MKKIDFIIQTILFALAIGCLICDVVIHKDYGILFMLTQFIIGCWQILSAIISITWNNNDVHAKKFLKIYWILVAIYFSGLVVGRQLFDLDGIAFMLWFYSAWGIAIYYYVVTQKRVKIKDERKTFLDIRVYTD